MALAYLIMAHGQPEHAARLVRRLSTPEDVVLVHVDRKADLAAFRAAFTAYGVDPVVVRRRVLVAWGGWSFVRAILAGVREALALDHPFTHLILLSGSDYPVQGTDAIHAFFSGQEDRSFLSWSFGEATQRSDAERRGNRTWSWSGDTERLLTWCINLRGRRYHLPNDAVRWMPRRHVPRGLVKAQGSNWFNLNREALEYTLRYLRRHPIRAAFFYNVFAPDENLFQMVLLGSPLRATLVNEDLRWMSWAVNHPPTILEADVAEAVATPPKLFARKFHPVESAAALDELDRLAGIAPVRLSAR